VGKYGDLCFFHVFGEPTELTVHLCISRDGDIIHHTIHGFKVYEERCIDFKDEYGIEIDVTLGRLHLVSK